MVRLNVDIRPAEQTEGRSRPVVFTHGWVDDLTVWDGVRQVITDRTTVAWDLRGHGRSDVPPPGAYRREQAIADLAGVVGQVEAPVFLVGHSLGGYLSLAFTLLHPERVAGLGLIASGPGFRNAETREKWNRSVDVAAARLGLPQGSEELSRHVDSWVLDELGSIKQPVVVVVGEHDRRFEPAVKVFESKLHVVRSVVVPDAGHSVHRNHPVETAAALQALFTTGSNGDADLS